MKFKFTSITRLKILGYACLLFSFTCSILTITGHVHLGVLGTFITLFLFLGITILLVDVRTTTMNDEKTFKTKIGFCHILPDKIVLTRDGIIGTVAKVRIRNNIYRVLNYIGLSALLFYFAFDSYKNGQIFQLILFGLMELYLIYGIIRSINNSATPIINRNKIREVKFKKAIIGVTRSRFEIYFEDENGKIKKRLIMLPCPLTDWQNETEKAIKIMTDEKLLTYR